MWLPGSARRLPTYGALVVVLRRLPTSFLVPRLFPSNTLSKSCSASCPKGVPGPALLYILIPSSSFRLEMQKEKAK